MSTVQYDHHCARCGHRLSNHNDSDGTCKSFECFCINFRLPSNDLPSVPPVQDTDLEILAKALEVGPAPAEPCPAHYAGTIDPRTGLSNDPELPCRCGAPGGEPGFGKRDRYLDRKALIQAVEDYEIPLYRRYLTLTPRPIYPGNL